LGVSGRLEPNPAQEWVPTLASQGLSQGDVLHRLDPSDDLWREWLIVVTADCDLAHEKHGGSLSCVPAINYKEYLRRFRADKISARTADKLINKIRTTADKKAPGSIALVSDTRLRSWLLEKSAAEVLETLGIEKALSADLVTCIEAYRRIANEKGSLEDIVEANSLGRHVLGEAKTAELARKSIIKEMIQTITRNLPGDAMFIGALSPECDEGRVVYLRRIVEVPDHSVVTTIRGVPFDAQYVRTARLAAPYIYALTQQLGAVFSAIGLPRGYEEQRDRIAADLDLEENEV
jgi:hypothetical protein